MKHLTILFLALCANLAAQPVTLDTLYLQRRDDSIFFQIREQQFADGSSIVESRLLGDSAAVATMLQSKLRDFAYREQTDLRALAALRAEKDRLYKYIEQVQRETGLSPTDTLQDYDRLTKVGWHIRSASVEGDIQFLIKDAALWWSIGESQGKAFLNESTLRLLDFPKPGYSEDLGEKKPGFWVGASGDTRMTVSKGEKRKDKSASEPPATPAKKTKKSKQ